MKIKHNCRHRNPIKTQKFGMHSALDDKRQQIILERDVMTAYIVSTIKCAINDSILPKFDNRDHADFYS